MADPKPSPDYWQRLLAVFIADWPEERRKILVSGSRHVIVHSAVREKVIRDDDLAMLPQLVGTHARLAGMIRNDIYEHHDATGKQLQFPVIASCFGYAFSKGAEAAHLWQASPTGHIDYNYVKQDALAGRCGLELPDAAVGAITRGMQMSYNVFCDFQNNFLVDPRFGFAAGGRWLADAIGCGLFWATQVGVDFGMDMLGHP